MTAQPDIVDRATWSAQIDQLRRWEKAHVRAGDALAAARRRLPMTEVDASTTIIGADGPVRLIDAFEGRRQLAAYFHMWHEGHPASEQCEGCTFFTSQRSDLGYLQSRDVTFAVICEGPYGESARYREFMGWSMRWYSMHPAAVPGTAEALLAGRGTALFVCYLRDGSRVFETYWAQWRGFEAMSSDYGLLDLTPFGRQEEWEDSPAGWPQRFRADGSYMTDHGRPSAQWSRVRAGHRDDLR